MRFRLATTGFWLAAACAPASDATHPVSTSSVPADTVAAALVLRCERVILGSPVAVCLDFGGTVVVADASPPRLIAYDAGTQACTEFQSPVDRPGFQASDVSVRGFFVYAVDETNRMLLRWDSSGAYRDVLLNFEELTQRRRVSPCGLDVDASGRLAVTDIENHQVIVLDTLPGCRRRLRQLRLVRGSTRRAAGRLVHPTRRVAGGGQWQCAPAGVLRRRTAVDA